MAQTASQNARPAVLSQEAIDFAYSLEGFAGLAAAHLFGFVSQPGSARPQNRL
jgi:hypothetical protein